MKKTFKIYSQYLICGSISELLRLLDIVPMKGKGCVYQSKAAEKYLYSCYGYLPQSDYVDDCLDFTGDETISPFNQCAYVKFAEGNYDSNNTILSYWNTLFQGIQCYLLKEHQYSSPVWTRL